MRRVRAYLFNLVGGQLINNSSRTRTPIILLELFNKFEWYALSSACLANLYRMLSRVAKAPQELLQHASSLKEVKDKKKEDDLIKP